MKFPTGKIVATPTALAALERNNQNASDFLDRHMNGDWGDCGEEDRKENDMSVALGDLRIFSVYHLKDQMKIYIITEADRSSTCLLLAEEY